MTRSYLPGTDLGTYVEDVDSLLQGANIISNKAESGNELNSGYFTATSVFAALQATALELGISVPGARIGIQGLGKVGLRLFQIAQKHGMKIVAVSTVKGTLYSEDGIDFEQISSLSEQHGDNLVFHYPQAALLSVEKFFHQKMDFMCPCAERHSIHENNIHFIKARAIIPATNVVARVETMDKLNAEGVIFLPGFVCNSGGILCYTLKSYGFVEKDIEYLIDRGIKHKVQGLLDMAKERGESPSVVAFQVSRNNQERFKLESASRKHGKLNLALTRLKTSGFLELYRTALWSLVRGRPLRLDSFSGKVAQSLIFNRIFTV